MGKRKKCPFGINCHQLNEPGGCPNKHSKNALKKARKARKKICKQHKNDPEWNENAKKKTK